MDTTGNTGAEPRSDTLLSVEHAGVLPGGALDPVSDEARERRQRRPRGRVLTPQARRAVAWALLALFIALIAAGIWWYLNPGDGSVPLAAAPRDSTATITFAGSFPADPEPPLRNPLGIAVIGERLFVAESDAGVIREFAPDGGRLQSIVLPWPSEAKPPYPSDLAVVDEKTLAVVEVASSRVLLVSLAAGAGEPIALGARDPSTAPKQPTSVARLADGIAVADGRDHDIKVYDTAGRYLRTLGAALDPALTYPGGMALVDGRLFVADSNSGRVLALDPETGAQVGELPGPLQLPRGIVPLDGGRVLVVCTFGRSLSLYDAAGVLSASITPHTVSIDPPARLALPRSAAWMTTTGRLYVSDSGSGRVRVYNLAAAGK
jgi:DNA-binding beta-propeller fold protein YncE